MPGLFVHAVIVVSDAQKQASSSDAHHRVQTSPQLAVRARVVPGRLRALKDALLVGDWGRAYGLTTQECHEMHALFESAQPPFGYWTAATRRVLSDVAKTWEATGDGPLVTVDAGPNVHVLFRSDQSLSALDHWAKEACVIRSDRHSVPWDLLASEWSTC